MVNEKAEDVTTNYRREILLALYNQGPTLMSDLRREVGFPAGSKGHHPDVLEKIGLIDVVDRVGANEERKFALTDRGRDLVREEVAGGELPEDVGERLKMLEQRVETLEAEKMDQSTFEAFTEYIEGEFWDSIVDLVERS